MLASLWCSSGLIACVLLPWMGCLGNVIKTMRDRCFPVLVQSLSCVWLFATPQTATHQASLSFTNSWSLLKFMSIESVMPSNHLILFSSCSQSFPASGIFSKELGFLWGNIKKQLNPNHDAVKSHMTARAASTPDFSASGSRSKLLLTSRGMVPHRTLPDGQCRYPYSECNALMLSVLGKILHRCIPLLRGCIFTIDNMDIHIRYRQQGGTYSLQTTRRYIFTRQQRDTEKRPGKKSNQLHNILVYFLLICSQYFLLLLLVCRYIVEIILQIQLKIVFFPIIL